MLENYVPDPENYRFVSGEEKRRMKWWHIWRIGDDMPLCRNSRVQEHEATTDEPCGKICKRCIARANELWED